MGPFTAFRIHTFEALPAQDCRASRYALSVYLEAIVLSRRTKACASPCKTSLLTLSYRGIWSLRRHCT